MYPKHVERINKITLLHQVGISSYFMRKMHGQTTLKLIYTTIGTEIPCRMLITITTLSHRMVRYRVIIYRVIIYSLLSILRGVSKIGWIHEI